MPARASAAPASVAPGDRPARLDLTCAAVALLAGLLAAGWIFSRTAAARGPLEWDEGGFVLRGWQASRALLAGHPLDALRAAAADRFYPPLHGLLLGAWFAAFGATETAAFAFSALALALSALGIALATREIAGRGAAAIAVACLLGSRLHLEYAGTALLELPGTALTLLAVWLVVRHLRVGRERSGWIAGVAIALVAFTKYNYGAPLAVAAWAAAALGGARNPLAPANRGLWLPLALAGAAWLCVPGVPAGLLGFAGNRTSGLGLFEGLAFYPRALMVEYAAWPLTGAAMLAGALVTGFGARGPAASARAARFLALFALLGIGAMVIHPYKLARAVATFVPALWVMGAVFWERAITRGANSPRARAVAWGTAFALLVAPLAPLDARDLPALPAGARPAWSSFVWPGRDLEPVARFLVEHTDPSRPLYMAGEFNELPPTTLRWKLLRRHPGLEIHERAFRGREAWRFPLQLATMEVLEGSRYLTADYRSVNAWALEPMRALDRAGLVPAVDTTFAAGVRLRLYRLDALP